MDEEEGYRLQSDKAGSSTLNRGHIDKQLIR